MGSSILTVIVAVPVNDKYMMTQRSPDLTHAKQWGTALKMGRNMMTGNTVLK